MTTTQLLNTKACTNSRLNCARFAGALPPTIEVACRGLRLRLALLEVNTSTDERYRDPSRRISSDVR